MTNPTTHSFYPDEAVISYIFPLSKPRKIDVLAQSTDTCTFLAQVERFNTRRCSQILLVRLERDVDRLDCIISFEHLAALKIPSLISRRIETGNLKDLNEQRIGYSVTEYTHDAVSLDSIWERLDQNQQNDIMDSVVDFVRLLHSLDFEHTTSTAKLRNLLPFMNKPESGAIPRKASEIPTGSLNLRFHNDFLSLFRSMIDHAGPDWAASATQRPGGSIAIVSFYEDIGEVLISRQELKILGDQLVLCHMDLEPRNIFVRRLAHTRRRRAYGLRAIMDWDMAGIFPFAYEYVCKDADLAPSSMLSSWNELFKEKMAALVPSDASNTKFIKAVRLIHASAERSKSEDGARDGEDEVRSHASSPEATRVAESEISELLDEI